MILACSEEDRELFVQCYGIDRNKIQVIPNGVDIKSVKPVPYDMKQSLKERLNIKGPAVLFFGSNYGPNIDAGKFIIDVLADECKDITFVIAGGVGSSLDSKNKKNVKILGIVSDEEKKMILEASDVAINPMFSGSGTNIKMFDYLAAGLPTITTAIGARGIDNPDAFIVADSRELQTVINRVLSDRDLYDKLSKNGRYLVVRQYDWNNISRNLGNTINRLYADSAPYFSVIVATNRGGAYLKTLFDHLNMQTYKNFEVILVDSSTDKGDEYKLLANFKLCYVFKEGIGATKARNVGISKGRGKVFVFTDDDCQPDADWLYNAKKYFDQQDIVGVEGYIYTDETKINDSRYRIVTNKGFEGLGFMTANLFIKSEVLRKIGGFDERFDKPHFREDTELAWRAIPYGRIPYAKDVRVFHPPLPRDLKGESRSDRDHFFVNDALLFYMYPERYVRLMKAEGHYKMNPNYWRYFLEGCRVMDLRIPIKYLMEDSEISRYVPAELKTFS
jgi:glycosyltransferase involved in cell wall biosynthesis